MLFSWHGGMAIVLLTPSTVVVNSCPDTLHIRPCELSGLDRADEGADTCTLAVAPEQSVAILLWHIMAEGGGTQAVRVQHGGAGHGDSCWSIPVSLSFVRRSFALPACRGASGPVHCVLSRHQHNHTTYVVISVDRSPRLLVQNLSGVPLEVVEAGVQGVDAAPQLVLSGTEVVYEPPSLAATYPVIQERVLPNQPAFALRLRKCPEQQEPLPIWSPPLTVSREDLETSVTLAGEEPRSFFVSAHQRGDTIHFAIMCAGEAASPLRVPSPPSDEVSISFSLDLSQTVLCLDDEASDPASLQEVVRVVADRLCLRYRSTPVEGGVVGVTLASIQVDNVLEHGGQDFAVVLLPRSEHVRRPSLVVKGEPPPLLRLSATHRAHSYHSVDHLSFSLEPVTVQVEDALIRKVIDMAGTFGVPEGLRVHEAAATKRAHVFPSTPPVGVILEAQRDVAPLVVREMVIEPISCYLSAKLSVGVYLSCDSTHFHFPLYRLGWTYTNWTELLQLLGAHYTSSLLTHVGSLVGSLDLLGSPGTFVRSIGSGLRDLFVLPYEGITRSPTLFVWGIGLGTAGFLYHLSSGALRSLVNFSSSVSHNMERLSLDPSHASYFEQSRRSRPPSHFISGVTGGVSSFGVSLISAVGGLVEQPLRGAYEGSSGLEVARGVLTGVGKGLLGVVTKPVGGAMELVSQTGKGLMLGTGLTENVRQRHLPPGSHAGTMRRVEAINVGSSSRCAG